MRAVRRQFPDVLTLERSLLDGDNAVAVCRQHTDDFTHDEPGDGAIGCL